MRCESTSIAYATQRAMKSSPPSLLPLVTAGSCVALLCTSPSEAFLASPSCAASSFASNCKLELSSRNAAAHLPTSTCGAATAGRSPRRCRPRVPGTMHSSLNDDRGVGDGGVFEAIFSEWKKVAAATAVGLAIFSGGILMPAGPGDAAMASMASSLMQDEKGYISIFEKVGYARG